MRRTSVEKCVYNFVRKIRTVAPMGTRVQNKRTPGATALGLKYKKVKSHVNVQGEKQPVVKYCYFTEAKNSQKFEMKSTCSMEWFTEKVDSKKLLIMAITVSVTYLSRASGRMRSVELHI